MNRRLSCAAVLAAAITLLAPFVSPEAAQATTVDQQQAEVERIVDELDRLHSQADILAEDYAEAVDRKRELDEEIVDAEGRVAAKEQELIELQTDVVTAALTEVALRLERATKADNLVELVREQIELVPATRDRIVEDATRAVTIFKTAGREFSNIAKHTVEIVYDKGKAEVEAAGKPVRRKAAAKKRPAARKAPARARKAAATAAA